MNLASTHENKLIKGILDAPIEIQLLEIKLESAHISGWFLVALWICYLKEFMS